MPYVRDEHGKWVPSNQNSIKKVPPVNAAEKSTSHLTPGTPSQLNTTSKKEIAAKKGATIFGAAVKRNSGDYGKLLKKSRENGEATWMRNSEGSTPPAVPPPQPPKTTTPGSAVGNSQVTIAPAAAPTKPIKPSKPAKPARKSSYPELSQNQTLPPPPTREQQYPQQQQQNLQLPQDRNGYRGLEIPNVSEYRGLEINIGGQDQQQPASTVRSVPSMSFSRSPSLSISGMSLTSAQDRARKISTLTMDGLSSIGTKLATNTTPQLVFGEGRVMGAGAGKARAREFEANVKEENRGIFENNEVIREGRFVKHNRSGGSDDVNFVLTLTHLVQCDTKMLSKYVNVRQAFLLVDTRVTLIAHGEIRIETKLKSFKARPREGDVEGWVSDISDMIKAARAEKNLGPDYESCVAFAPMWEENLSACEECKRDFSVLVRRHHCRRCGKCLCGACCFEKIRMDEIDKNKLHKACHNCATEVKSLRSKRGRSGYGAQAIV